MFIQAQVKAATADVRVKKEWLDIKTKQPMKKHSRDLLVLFKADVNSEQSLEEQVECLHQILIRVECADSFCTAHELATRTKITSKKKAILRAIETAELKPFHFLVNKN